MYGRNEKVALCKPGTQLSPETKPAGTLILNFHLPDLWENKCLAEPTQSVESYFDVFID